MAVAGVATLALLERPSLWRRLAVATLAALAVTAAATAADAPVVTITQTLPGLNNVSSGGFEPPDVQVAAGPGYVVEMVNLAVRFWRTGNGPAEQLTTMRLESFFGTDADRLTDPRVVYDTQTGRWWASISDLDAKSVHVAVSDTSDPTGHWTISSYEARGCADQPRLGLADGLVVLGADIFQNCEGEGSPASGSELWIINKAQLLAGSATPAMTTYGPDAGLASLTPVQSLSPTATEYVVSVNEPTSRVAHVLAVAGIPPASVSVTEVATPSINRLGRPPFAAQPATKGRASPGLDTNDDRVLDAVWQNGKLWFAANSGCVPPGDPLIRSCARIVELATPAMTVATDVDLSAAGANFLYPALRPNGNGDLVIVYGESGITIAPSTVVVARTADGTFTQPVVIAKSASPYRGNRYGDYFGAAVDPTDPATVWVAGESGTDIAGGGGWSTYVASAAVTPAGGTAPPVLVAPPPAVRAVAAVGRGGKLVQLSYRPVVDGLGVRAVVTVRSLRGAIVVRKTSGTITVHSGQAYSVPWQPAKALRGTFGYCVRTVTPAGVSSPPGCSTVTLHR
ncbi:MAG TPA: hypothetical protein VGH82_08375 [Gaiellaceae bacterium]